MVIKVPINEITIPTATQMDNLISMAMKEQGMSEPGEAEKQEFIRLIDENHDGKISKQEFINFIKQMNGMWFL